MTKYPNIEIQVIGIVNHFFGEQITVAGLLTATDILEQLQGIDLGDRVVLPAAVLKADEAVFLDDISLEDFQKALQVPAYIVKSNGMGFIQAITGDRPEESAGCGIQPDSVRCRYKEREDE